MRGDRPCSLLLRLVRVVSFLSAFSSADLIELAAIHRILLPYNKVSFDCAPLGRVASSAIVLLESLTITDKSLVLLAAVETAYSQQRPTNVGS
jgi:hypothetical protein